MRETMNMDNKGVFMIAGIKEAKTIFIWLN